MNISKREAFLLFFVGLIGIVGALYMFVISPLAKELSNNKFNYESLQNQKTMIESALPTKTKLQTKLDNQLADVATEMNKIQQPINEAEFEHWVLPLTTKYNMKVISTEFSEPEIVIPMALVTYPISYEYDIKTLVDAFNNVPPTIDETPYTESMLLLSHYKYVVDTTYARYLYFLNDVTSWDTSIYISASSYDFTSNEATFEFDVYAVEQLIENNDMDYTKDFDASGTGTGNTGEVAHPDLGSK